MNKPQDLQLENNQQLIIQKHPDNIYSVHVRRTIIQKESLEGDEVKTCNLLLGKGYQINDYLEIYLLDNTRHGGGLELCFQNKSSIRIEYKLKPHSKLENFYLVDEVKEEYLTELIAEKNLFFHTVSITGKNYEKTRN